MFHKTRRIACIVYLALLLGTFLAGVLDGPFVVVLLLLIAQGIAAIWYMVSYIPYGMYLSCGEIIFMFYVLLFPIAYVRQLRL